MFVRWFRNIFGIKYSVKSLPKYCKFCGEEYGAVEETYIDLYYNTSTGKIKKFKKVWWQCPRFSGGDDYGGEHGIRWLIGNTKKKYD